MALNTPETHHTVDGALDLCAEKINHLKPFGLCPKNLILITTAVLGSTAKNLGIAYQEAHNGLRENISSRYVDITFPSEIADRVKLITNSEGDPRLASASHSPTNLSSSMETYSEISKVLTTETAKLSEKADAKTLFEALTTIRETIREIPDEVLRITLEINLLLPLEALLTENNFDPQDRRTNLQNVASLATALGQEEVQFLQSVAQSEQSALSADAQKILDHLSPADELQTAA